jgi:predicted nucleic acid-binding protein
VTYLLDTNVVSEARKAQGNANVKRWLASVPRGSLYLSVLTIGEIRRGIEILRGRDPTQATVLDTWLTALRTGYLDRLLPVTTEISEEWGRLNVPDPVPTVDGLLAATARVHGLTLVTRNTRDLVRTGVRLLDPFQS